MTTPKKSYIPRIDPPPQVFSNSGLMGIMMDDSSSGRMAWSASPQLTGEHQARRGSGMRRRVVSTLDPRAWLEVADVRHRYAKNLRTYYEAWDLLGKPNAAGAQAMEASGEGSREGQAESKAEGKNRARRKYVVAALDHLQHEFSEEFSEQNSTARSEVSSQGAPTGNRKTKSQSKKEQQAEAWLSAVSNCILLERLPARCVNLHRPINIPPRFCADAPAPCCPHVARPDLSRASLGRSTFAHRELELC